MRKIALISSLIIEIFITGCDNSSTDEGPPLTCAGFRAQTLNIKVFDSVSDADIKDANVTLLVSSVNNTQSFDVAWNDTYSGYYIPAETLSDGTYSIVASRDTYNAAVVKNVEFNLDTSCGGINDWELTLYMCPLGTACI